MAVLPVIAAVAAVTAAAGAVTSGIASSNAASYSAQVAQNNATIASQNAAYATQAGQVKEQASRMKTAGVIGQQKAIQGASGLDVGSGSNLDVRNSTADLGELDALTIRNNAAREAYGYQTTGQSYQAQAGLDKMTSSNDLTAGFISGGSSLLSSASSLGEKFGWMQGSGAGTAAASGSNILDTNQIGGTNWKNPFG